MDHTGGCTKEFAYDTAYDQQMLNMVFKCIMCLSGSVVLKNLVPMDRLSYFLQFRFTTEVTEIRYYTQGASEPSFGELLYANSNPHFFKSYNFKLISSNK